MGERKNEAWRHTHVNLPSGGASLYGPLQEVPPALGIGQIYTTFFVLDIQQLRFWSLFRSMTIDTTVSAVPLKKKK